MELKEFLSQNPIINKKKLSEAMYPENKSPSSKLLNKLEEREVGSGKQRILPVDVEASVKALTKLRDSINQYIDSKTK